MGQPRCRPSDRPENCFRRVLGFRRRRSCFQDHQWRHELVEHQREPAEYPSQFDPARPRRPTTNIYIGTDLGVFRTTDGGVNWTPFNNGLPGLAIFDLVYNPSTSVLVAATHGRGMWQLPLPPNCWTQLKNCEAGAQDELSRCNCDNAYSTCLGDLGRQHPPLRACLSSSSGCEAQHESC